MFLNKFFSLSFWADPLTALGLTLYLGGSSSSSNKTDTDTITNNTGFSDIGGEVVNTNSTTTSDGRNNTVTTNLTTTDHDTVSGAFDFANNALTFSGSAMQSALQQNHQALQTVKASSESYMKELRGFAETSSTNNDERMLTAGKWLLGAVVVLGGIKLAKGK